MTPTVKYDPLIKSPEEQLVAQVKIAINDLNSAIVEAKKAGIIIEAYEGDKHIAIGESKVVVQEFKIRAATKHYL